MNVLSVIEAPPETQPFNAYKAYQAELERNRVLYRLLAEVIVILENEADYRDAHHRDGGTLRGIAARIKREALA